MERTGANVSNPHPNGTPTLHREGIDAFMVLSPLYSNGARHNV